MYRHAFVLLNQYPRGTAWLRYRRSLRRAPLVNRARHRLTYCQAEQIFRLVTTALSKRQPDAAPGPPFDLSAEPARRLRWFRRCEPDR
jgi:hypothetical protein